MCWCTIEEEYVWSLGWGFMAVWYFACFWNSEKVIFACWQPALISTYVTSVQIILIWSPGEETSCLRNSSWIGSFLRKNSWKIEGKHKSASYSAFKFSVSSLSHEKWKIKQSNKTIYSPLLWTLVFHFPFHYTNFVQQLYYKTCIPRWKVKWPALWFKL